MAKRRISAFFRVLWCDPVVLPVKGMFLYDDICRISLFSAMPFDNGTGKGHEAGLPRTDFSGKKRMADIPARCPRLAKAMPDVPGRGGRLRYAFVQKVPAFRAMDINNGFSP